MDGADWTCPAWQINCFGVTIGQASALRDQIISLSGWGDGWALDEIGPIVPDDVATPAWWFVPVTIRDLNV